MIMKSVVLTLVVLIAAQVAQKCLANSLGGQTVKVDQTIEQLSTEFQGKIEDLFTKQQQLGDKLIKGGDASGYSLRRISNIYAIIESFTYAIRRHSMEVAKQVIVSPDGLEAAKQLPGNDADFSELLQERAIMRGLVDCFQFTVFPWKLMYKYVAQYVTEAKQVSGPLKALVSSIFREMKNFDQLGDLSFKRFGEQLARKKITGEDELKTRLNLLDELIDKAVDCPQCSGLVEHDRDFYNVYPIFASEDDVVKIVEHYVDPDLLLTVYESNEVVRDHVPDFKPEEVEAVDFEAVETTRDRLAAK